MQQEPPEERRRPGERRRRREAERAAREAAEQAGVVQPLTRRELRRRQLEEQARLEAIATGELSLVDEQGSTVSLPSGSAESKASPGSAASASSGVSAASASSAAPAGSETSVPSRRSIRERANRASAERDQENATPPSERTGSGRRPVVRAPHTATGIRSIDSTGALSEVQPIARPAKEPDPGPLEDSLVSTDPGEWSGIVSPARTVGSAPVFADSPTPAPPPQAPSESAPAPPAPEPPPPGKSSGIEARTGESAEPEPDAGGQIHTEDERPRWSPLSSYSPASTEVPARLERRSVHERMADAAGPRTDLTPTRHSEEAPQTANPAVSVICVVILVLAVLVIAALVILLVLNQSSDSAEAGVWQPAVTWAAEFSAVMST